MPCYHPLSAWYGDRLPSGKRAITFTKPAAGVYERAQLELPCGQCIGCRLERSRQWAMRCVHEASLHRHNCFITLTYDERNNPGTLILRDYQLFMKRLRKHLGGQRVRFFHCGEYGEQFARPHYHAILFGHDFQDRRPWSNRNGVPLDRSPTLEKLWPHGFSTVGNVTFESAAYVARYIVKKINGPDAGRHYLGRKPEYVTMSRRPGIAADWFKRYRNDVLNYDHVVIRGRGVFKPPKFYDRILDNENPAMLRNIKYNRQREALDNPHDTGSRLYTRNDVEERRYSLQLPRSYEHDSQGLRHP